MAIKKRNIAGKDIPRKSNQGGITKKSVSNEQSASEKEHQYEGKAGQDALELALAKASENRRRVKETQVRDRKAQPKVEAGRYIAITTDCKLEHIFSCH